MTEHTLEDFKNARFAVNVDGRRAMRMDGGHWRTSSAGLYPHVALAEETGWRPIVEADDLTRRTIIGKNDLIDTLSQRIRELEGEREPAPLTLDTLREAWKNAVGPTAVYVGDTIIQRDPVGESFSVFEAEQDADYPRPPLDMRVLHRAPQPEPWQALADEMEELYDGYSLRAAEAAQFLYERGVRVTGGDET